LSRLEPGEIGQMALPPCHTLFQFLRERGRVELPALPTQRGYFSRVPFNIASYALLTLMAAQVCGLKPGSSFIRSAILHLYSNHVEQAKLQLSRERVRCRR